MIDLILAIIGGFLFLFLICFSILSIIENEKRAAGRALLLSFILPLPFFLMGVFDFQNENFFASTLLILTVITILILSIPFRGRDYQRSENPKSRIDERDIMFSRNKLIVGTDRFNEYYKDNPANKALDDKFRNKPGLLNKNAAYSDLYSFSAADASFATVDSLQNLVDKKPSQKNQAKIETAEITNFIKKWAKKLGVVSVGITELKDYHLYSTVGRGKDYGKPVELNHKYAIAFTVEMDKRMLDFAPHGPTVMESAQQYLSSGAIAVQLAEFIRNLGYPARAHIDANYRVVCPLVARDAGLGEIGRIGLLMTPELGPRVRLGVVTTDLPLVVDERKFDETVIDFCNICKKCAEACPPKALSEKERKNTDGVLRWKTNSEKCFTYWCAIGTDCGRCVRVCPYSHPNNFLHNLVRFGNKNSKIFRIFALKMDDFFYGRIPPTIINNKTDSFDCFI